MPIRRIKCTSIKVDATLEFVAIPVLDDTLNEFDDFWNVFGDAGYGIWVSNAKPLHIFEKLALPVYCKSPEHRRVCDSIFKLHTRATKWPKTIKDTKRTDFRVEGGGENIARLVNQSERCIAADLIGRQCLSCSF
jgi:hypothetical protein